MADPKKTAADAAASPDQPAAPAEGRQPAAKPDPRKQPPAEAPADGVRGGRLADLGPAALPEGVTYAIAREPLYISNPEAAAAPVRAFNPGDRVPAELVDKFGWHELTDIPEWASAPPAPAPESSEEQN